MGVRAGWGWGSLGTRSLHRSHTRVFSPLFKKMDISDSGVHTCIRSTRKAEGGETLSQKLTVVPCILKKSERISLRRGEGLRGHGPRPTTCTRNLTL